MFSRSLRSVARPVRGYVCPSCLVQGVEVPLRVLRSYSDNATTTKSDAISSVQQIIYKLAAGLKSEIDGETRSPPAIVSSGNENITQGAAKPPKKPKPEYRPKPKKGKALDANKLPASLDLEGEKTNTPLESLPQKDGSKASQPQTVGSGSDAVDVDNPVKSVPKSKKKAKKKRSINRKKVVRLILSKKVRKVMSTPALEIAHGARTEASGNQETGGSTVAPPTSDGDGSTLFDFIKTVQGIESSDKQDTPSEPKRKRSRKAKAESREALSGNPILKENLSSREVTITPLDMERSPVPSLSYGLERVLFNPGVYHLQDPRSRVYNFDPYLGSIMPIAEFNFAALNEYITSSKDTTLRDIAIKHGKKYMGSSSSMTAVLAHFHFLLSEWRPVNASMISRGFPDKVSSFTKISRSPSAVFLRYKDGVYAIDADKEFDSANVLMNLGKSMEKLLTMPVEEFERYRRSNDNKFSDGEGVSPEAYHYSTCCDFVMRAQLDAHDPRLPGTGMFDLKTRAVVSIRMDARNFEHGLGYQIKGRFGDFESFEREYFDMIRAAFLKYSLQVRIGRMDGIFVAFHNIERIFGFQYVSLPEMDQALHGQYDTTLGDTEFNLSLSLWNKILDKATEMFPERSLRFHFETRETKKPFMYIFAEPMTDEEIDKIQSRNQDKVAALQEKLLNPELGNTEAEGAVERSDEDLYISEDVPPESGLLEPRPDALESQEPDPSSHIEEVLEPPSSIAMPATCGGIPTPDSAMDESGSPTDVKPSDQPESIADSGETPRRDIFAMTLSIRNKVNGIYVTRPSTLAPGDKWSVDYELTGFSNMDRAWKFYEACQKRRAKQLGEMDEQVDNALSRYQLRLREMSKRGRKWRAKLDELDKDTGTVILKE